MNQKLAKLLAPRFGLYFICLILFAAAAAVMGDYYLAAAELLVVLVLFYFFRRSGARRRKEAERHLEELADSVGLAAKENMLHSPMPSVMFDPETGEVVWSNDRFLTITGEAEHMFDTRMAAAVPGFDARWLLEGKSEAPDEVLLNDRRYRVYGHLVRSGEKSKTHNLLATTYWMDVTALSEIRDTYLATRPVVALLLLDNYEDTLKAIDEAERARILSEINNELSAWTEGAGGLFTRLDRDRYLFVFEEQYLKSYVSDKFSVLDKIHAILNPAGMPVTLSIGVGTDSESMDELYQHAKLSLEMALSRGGDQAVVKNRFTFEFYGGRSKETEKRTKVKSRVMANALGELVADASCVFVMGHRFPDMDAVGSAAGVCAIARKRGVKAYIIQEAGATPSDDLIARLKEMPEYADAFLPEQEALLRTDSESLLIVVDTNRPDQVQSLPLLESCNKVAVIDHHRRAASYIESVALNFHEPYASSASELVTELIGYIMDPSDLLKGEAEALMAGLMLDTKNFTTRTGGRTFEAAAFLRRSGADTGEVKRFFQNDLEKTIEKCNILRSVQMYHETVAVATVDYPVERVSVAQAADELLNVVGVDASFVLCPGEEGKVVISGRSASDVNVQLILERLGGGGNAAVAGAQIDDKTVEETLQALFAAIDGYFSDETEPA